jgi:NADH-quinone oxidoreductase subunit N
MGKLTLLKAALAKGFVVLVVLMMLNAAIAVYYYLSVVREAYFRDPGDLPQIKLDWTTRAACVLLIGAILALGVVPNGFLNRVSDSIAKAGLGAPAAALVKETAPVRPQAGLPLPAVPVASVSN